VVYTDVIQCALMTVGMALVLYYAYQHPAVGGWENLEAQVTASHPDHFKLFHPPENPSSFTTFSIVFGLGMVLGPGYWIGNQVIVQRVLGARSLADARTGVLFGALVKVIFPVLLVMPGILAIVILPQALSGESTRQVFPLLVRDLLPAGLRGIVFAAMLAGMMGNVDSYLNSAATLWTKDVLRKYVFKPSGADPRVEAALDLRLGRSLTVAFLAAGVAVAPFVVNIFTFMQWMLSLLQGPTFALLIFGILWRRATAAGGLAGCAVGFGASILLDRFKKPIFGYDEPLLHVAWWSFVAASLSLVAVSLATAPIPRERLRGLVYGLPAGPAGDEKESGDGARS
jgi:SSS family solute:Na+ symporter